MEAGKELAEQCGDRGSVLRGGPAHLPGHAAKLAVARERNGCPLPGRPEKMLAR